MPLMAVIDTNVLVSGLLDGDKTSPTTDVLKSIMYGFVVPIYSNDIMLEYENVLNRDKFKFDKDKVKEFLEMISNLGFQVCGRETEVEFDDVSDLKFYEAMNAIDVPPVYLVTGNIKHFPNEERIVKPVDFVNLIGYYLDTGGAE